jgi:hypothetical protein
VQGGPRAQKHGGDAAVYDGGNCAAVMNIVAGYKGEEKNEAAMLLTWCRLLIMLDQWEERCNSAYFLWCSHTSHALVVDNLINQVSFGQVVTLDGFNTRPDIKEKR